MIPMPENPTVAILTDAQGKPLKVASNISRELKVVTTQDPAVFADEACNKPFVS